MEQNEAYYDPFEARKTSMDDIFDEIDSLATPMLGGSSEKMQVTSKLTNLL